MPFKLTVKVKLYITGAAVVLLLACSYFLLFKEKIAKISSLNSQLDLLGVNFLKIKQDEALLPKLEQKIVDAKLKIALIHSSVPADYAVAEYVDALTKLAYKMGIKDYDALIPLKGESLDKYTIVPFRLNFSCRYSRLIDYLRGLDEMERLTRVDAVRMKVNESDPSEVGITLDITAFVMPESKIDAKSEPKK